MSSMQYKFRYLAEKRDRAFRKDRFVYATADEFENKLAQFNPSHYIYVNKNGSVQKVRFGKLGVGVSPKKMIKGSHIYDKASEIVFVYPDQYQKTVDEKILKGIDDFSMIDKKAFSIDDAGFKAAEVAIKSSGGKWIFLSSNGYGGDIVCQGELDIATSYLSSRKASVINGNANSWNLYRDGNFLDLSNRYYINYCDKNSGGGDDLSRFFGPWYNLKNGYSFKDYNSRD